jgi:hypothetical protein
MDWTAIAQIATPIICGGAIPFIMKVNSRLAVIETKLDQVKELRDDYNELRENHNQLMGRVNLLEVKLAKYE